MKSGCTVLRAPDCLLRMLSVTSLLAPFARGTARMMRMCRLLAAGLITLSYTAAAAGQRATTIIDHTGNRVAAATIEIWSTSQRLVRASTDNTGIATFPDSLDAALLVYVTHPNFAAAYHRLNAGWPDTIRLRAQPLPTIEVIEPKRCPNKDDAAARALWKQVSARYKPVPEGAHIGTGFFQHKTIGGREVLAQRLTGPTPFTVRSAVHNESDKGWTPGYSIHRNGYATARTQSWFDDDSDTWQYAPLGDVASGHFVTPEFAGKHTLSVSSGDDGAIITFCPRDRKQNSIEGVLIVSADSALTAARWRFRTQKNDEGASGEAVFAPPAPVASYLFPVSSTFWRQHRMRDRYYVRQEEYGIWRVGTNEDIRAMIREWSERTGQWSVR